MDQRYEVDLPFRVILGITLPRLCEKVPGYLKFGSRRGRSEWTDGVIGPGALDLDVGFCCGGRTPLLTPPWHPALTSPLFPWPTGAFWAHSLLRSSFLLLSLGRLLPCSCPVAAPMPPHTAGNWLSRNLLGKAQPGAIGSDEPMPDPQQDARQTRYLPDLLDVDVR